MSIKVPKRPDRKIIKYDRLQWQTVIAHNKYVVHLDRNHTTNGSDVVIYGNGQHVRLPQTIIREASEKGGYNTHHAFAALLVDLAIKNLLIYHPFDTAL